MVLMVAIGAAVGAPARYLTDRFVQRRHRSAVPWGTFTVNVVACLLLGAVTGLGTSLSAAVVALLGTGFCGAYSTYSTYAVETTSLLSGRRWLGVAYALGSVVAGLAAVALGWRLASF